MKLAVCGTLFEPPESVGRSLIQPRPAARSAAGATSRSLRACSRAGPA
jgi:hypothetical protein